MDQSAVSPARASRAKAPKNTTPIATSPSAKAEKAVKPKAEKAVKPKAEKAVKPKAEKPKTEAEKAVKPKAVKPKAVKPKAEKAEKAEGVKAEKAVKPKADGVKAEKAVKPKAEKAVKPKAEKAVKPKAEKVAKPKRQFARRIPAAPMSPRTATLRLADPEPMSFSDVRSTTNNIAKSVTRIAQLALAIGHSGEVTTTEGDNLVRSDINTLVTRTVQAIRGIPSAARRSSRRVRVQLTDAERNERVKALNAKAAAGMAALDTFLKNKHAMGLLLANEAALVNDNVSPPKPEAGDPISAAFYISDNLREFFRGANLGNGIALFYPGQCSDVTRAINGAADPKGAVEAVARETGRNPVADLGGKVAEAHKFADPCYVITPLVIDRGIATSPLLMTLMAMYILANGLKTRDSRILVDDRMRKFFGTGNTHWIVNSTDLTKAAQAAGVATNPDSELSGLDRLLARMPKKAGCAAPYDGKTFTRAMSITLASYYRVRWVTPELSANLAKDCVRNLAYGVKSYL